MAEPTHGEPATPVEATPDAAPSPSSLPETASFLDPETTRTHQAGADNRPPGKRQETLPSVPGYEIEAVLGRGGMGVVYRARHLRLKRAVALKMILAGGHAGEAERTRFRTEAETVARLQHPHIVQIHEVGEHDGLPFCALEFVDGGSLATKLRARPLARREAARLVEALARAMHLAHSRNVVHRDLKPANVLLTADGVPKVTDFGLARQLDAESGQTQSGAVMGTPSYMAPEQASGQAHAAGPLADVYALGAILYECLTGRPPFRGANVVETLDQVRSQEPVAPSRFQAVPRDLETVCLKCLQKEPHQRYASAAELADDLRRFQEGRPVVARPVGGAERTLKWVKRNPLVAALLAVVMVVGVGGACGIVVNYLDARRNERTANEESGKKTQALDDLLQALHAEDEALHVKDEALKAEKRALTRAEEQNAASHVVLAQRELEKYGVAAGKAQLEQVAADHEPPLRCWEWHYLRRQFEGGLFTLYGHTAVVFKVAFSPDGKWLASGSRDRTARIWDAHTGAPLLELKGHSGSAFGVAFSPDSQRLATSDDNTARIWDARSGSLLLELKGHTSVVYGVAFSPDGERLATASWDKTARIWDARSGAPLRELKGHTDAVSAVAFSPDGEHLATVSRDLTARVWEARSGISLLELKGHTEEVHSVAFSPDGRRLATSSEDMTARVWDAHSGAALLELKGHSHGLFCVAYSPDGQRLATASEDGTARVWDARSGVSLVELKGHTGIVSGVAFSPDGQRLATSSYDLTARLWDVRGGAARLELKGHAGQVMGVSFSPDSQRVATVSWDKTARIWDARSGAFLLELKGHTEYVAAVAFSADGQRLATGSGDRTTRVWDARSGVCLLELKGHTKPVEDVAFSPDGQLLATANGDRTARVWDTASGACLVELKGHAGEVTGVAFGPDGRLATACEDKTARIWDARSGNLLLELKGHNHWVSAVTFSPDGQRLATASFDQSARIWNARSGELTLELKGHKAAVKRVRFSPDGRRLATASSDGTARVWDVDNGTPVLELQGHTTAVSGVAFSPDGQRLATASEDGSARVWEARPSAPPRELRGHSDMVSRVAFSPDSTRLTTWDRTGKALVWDLTTGRSTPETIARPATNTLRSPDGRWLALVLLEQERSVRLVDLSPPDADERTYRLWATRSDPIWHLWEADRGQREGQAFAAAFHLDRTVEGLPSAPNWLLRRGRDAAWLDRWPQAVADFAAVREQAPGNVTAWRGLVLAQLASGQTEAYQRTCTEFRGRFGTPAEGAVVGLQFAFRPGDVNAAVVVPWLVREPCLYPATEARLLVARTCVLAPPGVAEPLGLLPLAGRDPVVRAAVLCRAGRPAEAVRALAGRTDGVSLLWRALAECGQGQPDATRQTLDQAGKWLAAPATTDPKRTNAEQLTWEERLEVEVLRKEVEAQCASKRPEGKP